MTRINLVPPEELIRQHLIAEYRELPRVFSLANLARLKGEEPDDPRNPAEYVLGPGHVRFFYPRLCWLARRHDLLCQEMGKRGFSHNLLGFHNVYNNPTTSKYMAPWWGDWTPTAEAVALNRQRLAERTPG